MSFYNNIGHQSEILIDRCTEILEDIDCVFCQSDKCGAIIAKYLYDKRMIEKDDLLNLYYSHWNIVSFSENFFTYDYHYAKHYDKNTKIVYFYGKDKQNCDRTALKFYNDFIYILENLNIKYKRYGSKKQKNLRFVLE